jgi:hypothetical protein
MNDDQNAVSVNDAPRRIPRPATRREREQRAVLTLWFAVQRMLRRKSEPSGPSAAEAYPPGSPDVDDGASGAGVPRRPRGSSGSAAAAAEPPGDDSASRDIQHP